MSINATDTGTNNASTAGPDTSTNNAATTGPVVMSSVAPVQLPAQTGTRNATTQLIGTSVPSPTVSIPDAADAGISSTQRALVRTCLAVVDEHRKGNITHAQATIQIFGILPDDKFGIEAFTSYVEQLSQTDRDRLVASARGTGLALTPPIDPTSRTSAPSAVDGSLVAAQPDPSGETVGL